MLIPSARASLIKYYQDALFYNPTEPKHERQYVFYLLLRPILLWVKDEIISRSSYEPSEAESELYLLCCRLFDGFDLQKSSIIPYLNKYIPWKIAHLLRNLNKGYQKEIPSGLIAQEEEPYELQEEYYWKIPNILFTTRYVGNLFTIRQKYFIYILLMSDDNKITTKDLAESCNISRQTMKTRLLELKEVLNNWRT